MRKMTIAIVAASLMMFTACSKKHAATTPAADPKAAEMGAGSGSGSGSAEAPMDGTAKPEGANPCGGGAANPCGGE
jgi:hypothetical protein